MKSGDMLPSTYFTILDTAYGTFNHRKTAEFEDAHIVLNDARENFTISIWVPVQAWNSFLLCVGRFLRFCNIQGRHDDLRDGPPPFVMRDLDRCWMLTNTIGISVVKWGEYQGNQYYALDIFSLDKTSQVPTNERIRFGTVSCKKLWDDRFRIRELFFGDGSVRAAAETVQPRSHVDYIRALALWGQKEHEEMLRRACLGCQHPSERSVEHTCDPGDWEDYATTFSKLCKKKRNTLEAIGAAYYEATKKRLSMQPLMFNNLSPETKREYTLLATRSLLRTEQLVLEEEDGSKVDGETGWKWCQDMEKEQKAGGKTQIVAFPLKYFQMLYDDIGEDSDVAEE